MGISASKQWDEMNEVKQALDEAAAENQMKDSTSTASGSGEKKSFKSKLRSRILKSDPRSASEGVDRTPIAVDSGSGAASAVTACDTPVKTLSLIDPRSPGCVLGGEVVVERTPILVMQKKNEAGESGENTPIRGSSIPQFQLPETPDSEETPVSDSPLLLKTKTNKTSTPSTIPLTNPKTKQPSNLLQSRLREAADAAIKDKEVSDVHTAAAAGEFFDSSDVRHEDASRENSQNILVVSDNNESSLII